MAGYPKNADKKEYDPAKAMARIRHYCAYQERSHHEVKNKLHTLGLAPAEAGAVLAQLITDGFVNEERFAKAFAGGKFRMKQWGRLKIENELKGRGITPRCIRAGLREINEAEYGQTLSALLQKKEKELANLTPFARKQKAAAYALQKGYEPELIWKLLKDDI